MDGLTRREAVAAAAIGGALAGCGLAGGRTMVDSGVRLDSLSAVSWAPSGRCSPRAYLRRNPITGGVEAVSARCPHLGCLVRYASDTERFICPCHGGVFDDAGNPIAGPPKRPLQRLGTALSHGEVYLVGVRKTCT